MNARKFRDISLVEIDDEKTMAVACDSCGGIGEKEFDGLKVSAYITGRYTVRVGLCEILSVGADVAVVSNAVSNEMEPTAREVIRGIEDELKDAQLSGVALTGSTEENMKTVSTGVGITVIGIAKTDTLLTDSPQKGDVALLIGLPKLGQEVIDCTNKEIICYEDIYALRSLKGVRQIIPVGSKGICYEAQNAGSFILYDNPCADVYRSGGPSTCALAILPKVMLPSVEKMLASPHCIIGEYV